MILLSSHKNNSRKLTYLFCTIFTVGFLISIIIYMTDHSLSFLHYILLQIPNKFGPQNNCTNGGFVLPIQNIFRSPAFSVDRIYYYHAVAYDYYSQNDIGQSMAGNQWKIWPLPKETNHTAFTSNIQISLCVKSKLSFVDEIYVITDSRLIKRHENLKRIFDQQGISSESIQWRMKWNYTTCNSDLNHAYVYQQLNLKDKPLDKEQQRTCAVTMEHVDVWYEMVEKNVSLGLILEDDALFVPFFKEKITRMINAAIEKRILRLNDTCVKPKDKPISNDEWINQNPMIVIGTCFNFHDQDFQSHLINAPPMFSTHKSNSSRCTHAYLLTSCSAQALVDQIHAQKNDFLPSDFMQTHLFQLSSTLQSFWMDPPLSYQGNQVIDFDNIETFNEQTYN